MISVVCFTFVVPDNKTVYCIDDVMNIYIQCFLLSIKFIFGTLLYTEILLVPLLGNYPELGAYDRTIFYKRWG